MICMQFISTSSIVSIKVWFSGIGMLQSYDPHDACITFCDFKQISVEFCRSAVLIFWDQTGAIWLINIYCKNLQLSTVPSSFKYSGNFEKRIVDVFISRLLVWCCRLFVWCWRLLGNLSQWHPLTYDFIDLLNGYSFLQCLSSIFQNFSHPSCKIPPNGQSYISIKYMWFLTKNKHHVLAL